MSSSSSNNLYKTTTGIISATAQGCINDFVTKEWQDLDIEPLASIGFTKNHLFQIKSQSKLQPQIVQDSIYAFAFDLQENNKAKNIKGDPINYFMGILRNGRVYTFPGNYESPQNKAMQLYMNQRRKIEQKKQLLESEALDLAFREWFSQLNNEKKVAFLPENMQNTKMTFGKNKAIETAARNYFVAEIWFEKKLEIIQSPSMSLCLL